MFPSARVLNEDTFSSDHTTLILELGNQRSSGYRKFRFENSWIGNPECINIINQGLERSRGNDITRHISKCTSDLSVWGMAHRRNFKGKLAFCRKRIKKLKKKGRDQISIQQLQADRSTTRK